MTSIVSVKRLSVDDIVNMSDDELRKYVENLGKETKGLSQSQLQKLVVVAEWHLKAKAKKEVEEAERIQRLWERRKKEREYNAWLIQVRQDISEKREKREKLKAQVGLERRKKKQERGC